MSNGTLITGKVPLHSEAYVSSGTCLRKHFYLVGHISDQSHSCRGPDIPKGTSLINVCAFMSSMYVSKR